MIKALITIIVIIVAGIGIGTSASTFVKNDNNKQVLSTQSEQQQAKEVEVQVPLPGVPKTVRIPKLNVDTEIESVENDDKGRMDVPKNDDNTAWYNPGFRPGLKGNAVLAGHFDKKDGSPAVFWDLEKLVEGDEIIITDDKGKEWKFEVAKAQKHPNKDFPIQEVFGNSSDAMLNLITCDGSWTKEKGYADRFVVYSKLITE